MEGIQTSYQTFGNKTCEGMWSLNYTRIRHDKAMTSDNDYDNTCQVTRQDNDNKFSKNK